MLKPYRDLIVILQDPPPEKIGLVFMPILPERDKFAENTQVLLRGRIVAAGPGMMINRKRAPARFVPTEVKVGDAVVWDEWKGMECPVPEEGNHVIMHECDLTGVVE